MVWTPIGWIDQGEDPADLYEAPYPDFCRGCGARINPDPQVLKEYFRIGPDEDDFDWEYVVWWECPRCMEKYKDNHY